MMNQKLTPGVVNVLIYYVMLRSDMKLAKTYVEKIAGHWARKKVGTVAEAMALAKEENRQYQEWAETEERSYIQENSTKRNGTRLAERRAERTRERNCEKRCKC